MSLADPRSVRDWEAAAFILSPVKEVRFGVVRLWRDGGGRVWWVQKINPAAGVQLSRSASAAARKAAHLRRLATLDPRTIKTILT